MNVLRFTGVDDAGRLDPVMVGLEGIELARAAAGGLRILPTLVIGTGVFDSYRDSGLLADVVMADVMSFALEAEATQLTVRPTAARDVIGFPPPEQAGVEPGHLRYLVERIYRSWSSSRARAHRLSRHIPDDESRPAVIVQAPRSARSQSLSTRNPQTGTQTCAADYRRNVNNRVEEFKAEYATLIRKVEDVRRQPSQIEFEEDAGNQYLVRLGPQVMSARAMLAFVAGQHASGVLDDAGALCLIEPLMLGSVVQTSYSFRGDGQTVRGIAASPGISCGRLIWPRASHPDPGSELCILVVRYFSPDLLGTLAQCVGAFSDREGKTGHLAVVSRGLGIPAVVGIDQITLDMRRQLILVGGRSLEGDFAHVNGGAGAVHIGQRPASLLRTRRFENSVSLSFIDWVDGLAQALVDRGEFAALPVPAQAHIAALRQMVAKIRTGHD